MFRVGSLGQRGEQALGDWPGFANYMISGRSYLAGPPGIGVSSTNTTPVTSDTLIAVIAYIHRPCTISGATLRTSSSNVSVGASVRLGLFICTEDGVPGSLISQYSAGSLIGDSAQNTNITQSFDNPVIITEPCKVFIVSQHTAVTTNARFTVNGSLSPFSSVEGCSSASNAINSVGICGFTGSAAYSNGMPSSFGTATVSSTLADCHAASFTLA